MIYNTTVRVVALIDASSSGLAIQRLRKLLDHAGFETMPDGNDAFVSDDQTLEAESRSCPK